MRSLSKSRRNLLRIVNYIRRNFKIQLGLAEFDPFRSDLTEHYMFFWKNTIRHRKILM